MSSKIYLGKGQWVTSDRLANNGLETPQSGKMGNRPTHIEPPLIQPEMFPVANAEQITHDPVGNTMPVMTWDEPNSNYSAHATPSENQQEEPLKIPVMTWD